MEKLHKIPRKSYCARLKMSIHGWIQFDLSFQEYLISCHTHIKNIYWDILLFLY